MKCDINFRELETDEDFELASTIMEAITRRHKVPTEEPGIKFRNATDQSPAGAVVEPDGIAPGQPPAGAFVEQEETFPAPPPPPAPPSAPVAPVPPAPPLPSAPPALPETDCDGYRYDPRIHSKPPSIKKDGKWRLKRGVDKGLVETVQAEQRGTPVAPVAPPPPPAPPAPAAPVTPGLPAPTNLVEFMQGAKRLGVGPTALHGVVQALGLAGAANLADRPDLLPQAWAGVQLAAVAQ